MKSRESVDGVATVTGYSINPMITLVPVSASGSGSVSVKPDAAGADFSPVYDEAGDPLALDLSAQDSRVIQGRFTAVKVTSDTAEDEFILSVT